MEQERHSLMVADKKKYPDQLHRFESSETDPLLIAGEVAGLVKEGKRRALEQSGSETGWGMAVFNNLYLKLSREQQEYMREAGIFDKKRETVSSFEHEHSDIYKDNIVGKFYDDLNSAAKASGLDPEEEIFKPLQAREIETDQIYENKRLIDTYILMRAQGYNHADLTR